MTQVNWWLKLIDTTTWLTTQVDWHHKLIGNSNWFIFHYGHRQTDGLTIFVAFMAKNHPPWSRPVWNQVVISLFSTLIIFSIFLPYLLYYLLDILFVTVQCREQGSFPICSRIFSCHSEIMNYIRLCVIGPFKTHDKN